MTSQPREVSPPPAIPEFADIFHPEELAALRRENLGREAAVRWLALFARAVSVLAVLVGLYLGLAAVLMLLEVPSEFLALAAPDTAAMILGLGSVACFVAAAVSYVLGSGLRALRPWARLLGLAVCMMLFVIGAVGATVAAVTQGAAAGLGVFATAVVPCLAVSWVLAAPGAEVVFSDEYLSILARTGGMKTGRGAMLPVLVFVFVGLALAVIVLALFKG